MQAALHPGRRVLPASCDFQCTYACSVRTPAYRRTYVRFRVLPASGAAAARARPHEGLRVLGRGAPASSHDRVRLARRAALERVRRRSPARPRHRARPASRLPGRTLQYRRLERRPLRPPARADATLRHADGVGESGRRAGRTEQPPRRSARRVPAPLAPLPSQPCGYQAGSERTCRRRTRWAPHENRGIDRQQL